jgi:hypothetical protein
MMKTKMIPITRKMNERATIVIIVSTQTNYIWGSNRLFVSKSLACGLSSLPNVPSKEVEVKWESFLQWKNDGVQRREVDWISGDAKTKRSSLSSAIILGNAVHRRARLQLLLLLGVCI